MNKDGEVDGPAYRSEIVESQQRERKDLKRQAKNNRDERQQKMIKLAHQRSLFDDLDADLDKSTESTDEPIESGSNVDHAEIRPRAKSTTNKKVTDNHERDFSSKFFLPIGGINCFVFDKKLKNNREQGYN